MRLSVRHHAAVTPSHLLTYVTSKAMSMQHIYQPVLVRALVDSGGAATTRQLARAYVQEDEVLLGLVEERLKAMPLRVLKKNGVVTQVDGIWRLAVGKLTHTEREELRLACEARLRDFVVQQAFWDGNPAKMPSRVPGAVLKEAEFAWAACRSNTKPLQVDHVVPKSKGGGNSVQNLQALCNDCNLCESDKHWIDFRKSGHPHRPLQSRADVDYWWDNRPSVTGSPPHL